MITTRKIKLSIVSDNRTEAYSWIRKEMKTQNKALNASMSHLFWCYESKQKLKTIDSSFLQKEKKLEEQIEKALEQHRKATTETTKKKFLDLVCARKEKLKNMRKQKNKELSEQFSKIIGASEQTSIRDMVTSKYDLSSDTKDRLCQIAHQDFYNDIPSVLAGERTLRNYKKTNPLYIRGRSLQFYKEDRDILIKWNKGIIFKCILRSKRQNSTELYKTLKQILDGNWKICDSSLSFNRENHLILNLTLDIPICQIEKSAKVPGRVVGVDLGLKIPAYVALNDDPYIRNAIGSIDNFLKVRTSIQKRRRRL